MSRTFRDRVAWLYDLSHWSNRRVNAAAAARIVELIPVGVRALDCAAGTGKFSLAAARRAGWLLCTDQSEAMLNRARKKAAKRGRSNIGFAVRDIIALPEGIGILEKPRCSS